MKQATVSPKLTLEENLETLINAFAADVNEERPQKLGEVSDCEDTTSGVEMEQDIYGWFSDL